jgi:hypothetical protein
MKSRASIFLALVAVVAAVVSVWYGQRPTTPAQATWDEVLIEAKAGGYRIITTKELADLYGKDSSAQLLVDTRQEWEYRTGHMEGALNFPMEPTWWSRWRKAGDLEDFLGSDKERYLVFY